MKTVIILMILSTIAAIACSISVYVWLESGDASDAGFAVFYGLTSVSISIHSAAKRIEG